MRAAVSTCGDSATGLLLLNNTRHTIAFTSNSRDKRQVEMAAEEAEDSLTLVVTGGQQQQQPEHRSVSLTPHHLKASNQWFISCLCIIHVLRVCWCRCGLTRTNMARLRVTERPVVRLRRETPRRRSKRSTKERVIEIAVFVVSSHWSAAGHVTR